MKSESRTFLWCLVLLPCLSSTAGAAKLRPETLEAWARYQSLTEARIAREIESSERFLVLDFFSDQDAAAVRRELEAGEVVIRRMKTLNEEGGDIKIPDGLLHHWYGSVLVPGSTLSEVLAAVQSYDNHESYFLEVERSRLVSREGDTFEIFLRLRRKKVITVHYNTEHRVEYRRRSAHAATSRSEATRIAEIEDPGSEHEREKPVGNDRGFLWRLNSYWRFQETTRGVIVECESISLSRSVPMAFRWVVQSFIKSVPRESLAGALHPLRGNFVQGEANGAP